MSALGGDMLSCCSRMHSATVSTVDDKAESQYDGLEEYQPTATSHEYLEMDTVPAPASRGHYEGLQRQRDAGRVREDAAYDRLNESLRYPQQPDYLTVVG